MRQGDLIHVKPRAGLKVRDPRTAAHIPDSGAWLPDSSYVRRRLKSGDLVEAAPPGPVKPGKPAARSEGMKSEGN